MNVEKKGKDFFIRLDNGEKAVIKTVKEGKNLRVVSSFTPKNHRGKGLASKIMRRVLDYAKVNNLVIAPECSFADYYCKKHEC